MAVNKLAVAFSLTPYGIIMIILLGCTKTIIRFNLVKLEQIISKHVEH